MLVPAMELGHWRWADECLTWRVFCCAELFTLGFHVAMSMVFFAFVRRIIAVVQNHFNGFRGKPGGETH